MPDFSAAQRPMTRPMTRLRARLNVFLIGLMASAFVPHVAHAAPAGNASGKVVKTAASKKPQKPRHSPKPQKAPKPVTARPQTLGEAVHRAGDRASEIVMRAMGTLGTPYRFGGTSIETGFDCSGFVRAMVQQAAGMLLPRTAAEQAAATHKIEKDELRPGDLVFFNTMRRAYSHVGIYVGDGKFVHSPRTGSHVRVDNMGSKYWKARFNGARRVFRSSGDTLHASAAGATAGGAAPRLSASGSSSWIDASMASVQLPGMQLAAMQAATPSLAAVAAQPEPRPTFQTPALGEMSARAAMPTNAAAASLAVAQPAARAAQPVQLAQAGTGLEAGAPLLSEPVPAPAEVQRDTPRDHAAAPATARPQKASKASAGKPGRDDGATRPASKGTGKGKPAAKSTAKSQAKPAAKPTSKAASKTAKPAAKPAAKKPPAKPAKSAKAKSG